MAQGEQPSLGRTLLRNLHMVRTDGHHLPSPQQATAATARLTSWHVERARLR